jgi:anti-sigma factor RsiW
MTEPTFDPQQLHAYLDGELTQAERVEVERVLARDPEASAYLAGLQSLQGALVAGLEAEAAKVPEARFEQIWDEIERTLDRDLRLQKAPAPAPSFWARFRGVLRPLFVPAVSVAAVAGLVVVVWGGRDVGDAPTNTAPIVASNPAPEQPVLPDSPGPAVEETEIVLPAPNGGPAHIQRIDWGVKSGRISEIEGKRATTTVIWISDDDSSSSERSL